MLLGGRTPVQRNCTVHTHGSGELAIGVRVGGEQTPGVKMWEKPNTIVRGPFQSFVWVHLSSMYTTGVNE